MHTTRSRSRALLAALSLTLIALSSPAHALAQGIGTAEYEMDYGRRAFQSGRYDAATTYFLSAIHLDPDHAEAHFLLGSAYARLNQPDKARPYLEKAARLDPAKYRKEADALLAAGANAAKAAPKTGAGETIAEYRVGDAVEVFSGGRWNPGRVVAVEGRGKSVFATVEYAFNNDRSRDRFFYNALRRRPAGGPAATPGKPKPPAAAAAAAGAGLTPGTYGCSEKQRSGSQWVFLPRGSLTLRPDGTYAATRGGGRYRYDAATKTVTFTGGYFGNAGAKGKVVGPGHLQIEFARGLFWTAALQKR